MEVKLKCTRTFDLVTISKESNLIVISKFFKLTITLNFTFSLVRLDPEKNGAEKDIDFSSRMLTAI